jgi:hypothetical protein
LQEDAAARIDVTLLLDCYALEKRRRLMETWANYCDPKAALNNVFSMRKQT